MKYIKKVVGAIELFLGLLLLEVLLDNLDGFIVGNLQFNMHDWTYEMRQYHTIQRIIAIVAFSLVVTCVWEISVKYVKKRKNLVGIISFFLLIISTIVFWRYVNKVCFSIEDSPAKYYYEATLGSLFRMNLITGIYICLIFCIGIVTTCGGEFIGDKIQGNILSKTFSHYDVFGHLLSIALPVMLYLAGIPWISIANIPIIGTVAIISGLLIVIHVVRGVIAYRKTNEYYNDYVKNVTSDTHEIRVSENNNEPSALYKFFWKDQSLLKELKNKNIYLVTDEICARDSEVGIALDLYTDLWLKNKKKRQDLVGRMLSRKSVFHMAGCNDEDDLSYLSREYDAATVIGMSTVEQITKLTELLDFRRKQVKLLSMIHINKLQTTNCILDQIISFRDSLSDEYDLFMVFDFCVKWLEIINYFYTLVMIAHTNIQVSRSMDRDLENMSFGTWRDLRNRRRYRDNAMTRLLNAPCEDVSVFTDFNKAWNAITTQEEYPFQRKSINELLAAANGIRDYTRGHGVFSFEISQEINLEIITILVSLINFMIDNHWMEEDFNELEQNGWVVYSGDTPYFLYSHDPINKEYQFDSFQAGNSLSVPDDYREVMV